MTVSPLLTRRAFSLLLGALFVPSLAHSQETGTEPHAAPPAVPANKAAALIAAARSQIGVTLGYDPSYRKIDYPGGDVPREIGVCTDVVIRAYRDGLGMDLQQLVHEDMRSNFSLYPKNWGLSKTDRNIDHRRVPNLQTFFKRKGEAFAASTDPADYKPGDIVTQLVLDKLPHIGILSDRRSSDGLRPLVIHNIGLGTQEDDILFAHRLTGRYRFALLG